MRAVIQRVKEAGVTIDNKRYSKINKGLLLLLAVGEDDSYQDLDYIVKKTVNLRIFSDGEGKMNLSVKDIEGELLIVSQFTLYGDARKGRRPNFTKSASPEKAIHYYEKAVKAFEEELGEVKTGKFAADMDITLINDGPVTIQLDSTKIY